MAVAVVVEAERLQVLQLQKVLGRFIMLEVVVVEAELDILLALVLAVDHPQVALVERDQLRLEAEVALVEFQAQLEVALVALGEREVLVVDPAHLQVDPAPVVVAGVNT